MAMSARATNIGGRMVAETSNGERRYHCHDSQGNTIALINDAGSVTDTYTFWPNGEVRTFTGSLNSTPFKFGGAWGYYDDGNQLYIRFRYLREELGRWITKDPLWPIEPSFSYAKNNPVTNNDPFGLFWCKTIHESHAECPILAFSWIIEWQVPLPTYNGFIVQHVISVRTGAVCGKKLPPPKRVEFYELWEVAGQKIYMGYRSRGIVGNKDFWQVSGVKRCFSYEATTTGEACFLIGANIPGWQLGVGESGQLPGSLSPPKEWSRRKGCIKRKLTFKYTCCKDPECNCPTGIDRISLVTSGCAK